MMFPGQHMSTNTAAERKARDAAYAKWAAEERARIAYQRKPLTQSKPGPVRQALINRMLDRAWALLDASECEAADALLEFVPEDQAEALLKEFFGDDA
jgi:hypothetical protein